MSFFHKSFGKNFNNVRILIAVTFISVLAISVIVYNSGYYNNYLMFSQPFHLLLGHEKLYTFHPELYGDIFKYSPVFAFVMEIFTYLPDESGIVLWNITGVTVLLIAINKYFETTIEKKRALLILFPAILL